MHLRSRSRVGRSILRIRRQFGSQSHSQDAGGNYKGLFSNNEPLVTWRCNKFSFYLHFKRLLRDGWKMTDVPAAPWLGFYTRGSADCPRMGGMRSWGGKDEWILAESCPFPFSADPPFSLDSFSFPHFCFFSSDKRTQNKWREMKAWKMAVVKHLKWPVGTVYSFPFRSLLWEWTRPSALPLHIRWIAHHQLQTCSRQNITHTCYLRNNQFELGLWFSHLT